MKTLAALLLMTTAATAQLNPWPTTVPWEESGRVLGTATTNGAMTYLRDRNGVHIATVVEIDGAKIILDPSGRPFWPADKPKD